MVGPLIQFSGLREMQTQNESIKLKYIHVKNLILVITIYQFLLERYFIWPSFSFLLKATFPKMYPSTNEFGSQKISCSSVSP